MVNVNDLPANGKNERRLHPKRNLITRQELTKAADLSTTNQPLTQYECLRDDLRNKIDSGIYAPGDRIPSENELCKIYSVSRVTVRNAIQGLVEDGLLVKKKGSGTYVSPKPTASNSYLIGSFTDNCKRGGMVPSTQVKSIRKINPPSSVSEMLGGVGEVIEVQRIRLANGTPCILEIDYLPIFLEQVANSLLTEPSMFEALKQAEVGPIAGFEDRFGACLAGAGISQDLSCDPSNPLLTVLEQLSDSNGTPIYVSQQFINTERYTHRIGASNRL